MQTTALKQSKIISEKVVCQQKWLGISQITYSLAGVVHEGYESVFRTTKKQKSFPIDGAQILPIIKRKNQIPQIVIIANFRPATGKFCLQFPAGLIDDEDFQKNALRQLKEQTGYIATQILRIPNVPVHNDPWKSSQSGMLYVGIIDGDDPNHYEKQELEKSQNIRVYTFKFDGSLSQTIVKFIKEKDYIIHTKVWALILGFNLLKYLI